MKKKTDSTMEFGTSLHKLNTGSSGLYEYNVAINSSLKNKLEGNNLVKLDSCLKSLFLKISCIWQRVVFLSFRPDSFINITCNFFSILEISKKGWCNNIIYSSKNMKFISIWLDELVKEHKMCIILNKKVNVKIASLLIARRVSFFFFYLYGPLFYMKLLNFFINKSKQQYYLRRTKQINLK